MKLKGLLAVGILAFLSVNAVAQSKKILADKIIGAVGDKYILKSDVENAIADFKRQAQGQEGVSIPTQCMIIESQLIRKALVLQAEKDSISVTR